MDGVYILFRGVCTLPQNCLCYCVIKMNLSKCTYSSLKDVWQYNVVFNYS
jgi:hypothetical protein